MAAGTITLTNNSDTVAGAGTAFLTDLAAGDFIVANVGGIAYTLPVKAVASAIALTIVNKFSGPTMSGLAWFVITRDQQALVTAALVAQSTEALRVLNYDKSNWQAVFSAAGDITVTLPDGTQFTGPSWQKIVQMLQDVDLDEVQALVDQVSLDAQQVSADKSATETAKADAVSAKDAAETAANTSSAAKTDAVAAKDAAQTAAGTATAQASASEASAVRAETAAGSIDTAALLRKDDNLASLTDKGAARTELSVFSKAEINARIGYALISVGAVAINTRTVQTNPFGNNVPVIVEAELFSNGVWGKTGWAFNGSNANSFGVSAGFVEGVGIVIQTGQNGLATNSVLTGGLHGPISATTTGNCRIHVWKVTA